MAATLRSTRNKADLFSSHERTFKLTSVANFIYVFFSHFCQASPVSSLTLHVDDVLSKVLKLLHRWPEGHDLATGVLVVGF